MARRNGRAEIGNVSATRRVLLDSDTGVDDSLAILVVLAMPGVELLGIGSTYGNCRTGQAARNALCTLEAAGADQVPVAEGVPEPAGAEPLIAFAAPVHGSDGLGDAGFRPARLRVTGESAVDQLVRVSGTRGAEVDLIALGPLTNLAAALDRDPEVLARFHSITVMGGMGPDWLARAPSERHPGFLEVGDPNTRHNPAAAAALAACRAPVTWVGMNVTGGILLPESLLERAAEAGGRKALFARATHRVYSSFVTERSGSAERVFTAHDSIAAMAALDPDAVLQQVDGTPYLGSAAEGRPALWGRPPQPGEAVHRFVTSIDRDRLEWRLLEALA